MGSGVGVGKPNMVETEEQPVRISAVVIKKIMQANMNCLVFIFGLLFDLTFRKFYNSGNRRT